MQKKSIICCLLSVVFLSACAGMNEDRGYADTPTVDYVERLDVYSAPHKDSFLNQLAMNYRSYAVYNARKVGDLEIGERFAQKAVAAFSGETPFPETLESWPIEDEQAGFELHNAYSDLMDQLKNDAADNFPEMAAEAQAKYDCWLSATAGGQRATANECKTRFKKAIEALRAECKIAPKPAGEAKESKMTRVSKTETYYPETGDMTAMNTGGRTREGVIIVNNVTIPEHLIRPVPVEPMVFNQNIYSDGEVVNGNGERGTLGEEGVDRAEFINMMMALRSELAAINERLDKIEGDRTMIKVQQIPLEPKQHVMEEIFEIKFDFNKSKIKPEYEDLIRKLATATRENNNIKVSVVGHTDTAGSNDYNYALGGRRAEAVQKMLVQYGIPAASIVAVSSGEKDLKVPTKDNVPNADNRRVRVVKEVHYTTPGKPAPLSVEVESMYGEEE